MVRTDGCGGGVRRGVGGLVEGLEIESGQFWRGGREEACWMEERAPGGWRNGGAPGEGGLGKSRDVESGMVT
jgi:hypothetical protein